MGLIYPKSVSVYGRIRFKRSFLNTQSIAKILKTHYFKQTPGKTVLGIVYVH